VHLRHEKGRTAFMSARLVSARITVRLWRRRSYQRAAAPQPARTDRGSRRRCPDTLAADAGGLSRGWARRCADDRTCRLC